MNTPKTKENIVTCKLTDCLDRNYKHCFVCGWMEDDCKCAQYKQCNQKKEAMEEMECWQTEKHLKECLKCSTLHEQAVQERVVEVLESVDLEQSRKLYGTDFAAGMEKMRRIAITKIEEQV